MAGNSDEIRNMMETMDDSVSVFSSSVYMENWNIKKSIIDEFARRKPDATMHEKNIILGIVKNYSEFDYIKQFFSGVMFDTLTAIKGYAAGGDTGKYPEKSPFMQPIKRNLAASISGRINMNTAENDMFHFTVYADLGGPYRYVHLGQPNWEKYVDKLVSKGGYLFISEENMKYPPEKMSISPKGIRGIVRRISDKQGRLTALGQMLQSRESRPNPFIPNIMKYLWQTDFEPTYQKHILGEHIPNLVKMFINRGK